MKELPVHTVSPEIFNEEYKELLSLCSAAGIEKTFNEYISDHLRQALAPLGFYFTLVFYINGHLGASAAKIKKLELSKAVSGYLSLFNHGLGQHQKNADWKYRHEIVEQPQKVYEVDFDYSLLNDIFFRNIGPFVGKKELLIGDLLVTKTVSHSYFSNSGKSKDHKVLLECPHSVVHDKC